MGFVITYYLIFVKTGLIPVLPDSPRRAMSRAACGGLLYLFAFGIGSGVSLGVGLQGTSFYTQITKMYGASVRDVETHQSTQAFYLDDPVYLFNLGGRSVVEIRPCGDDQYTPSYDVCFLAVWVVPVVSRAQASTMDPQYPPPFSTFLVYQQETGEDGYTSTTIFNAVAKQEARLYFDNSTTTVRPNPADVDLDMRGLLSWIQKRGLNYTTPLNMLRQKDPLDKIFYYSNMAEIAGGVAGGFYIILMIYVAYQCSQRTKPPPRPKRTSKVHVGESTKEESEASWATPRKDAKSCSDSAPVSDDKPETSLPSS